MVHHTQITEATGMTVHFCDPHAAWQRGTNENTNGLLRQYFPQGHQPSPALRRRPRRRPGRAQRPTAKDARLAVPAAFLNRLQSANQ
jgi:IS30 family transposase